MTDPRFTKYPFLLFAALCVLAPFFTVSAQESAQTEQPAQPPTETKTVKQVDPARRSPQATVRTFLAAIREQRIDDAVGCLDLSHLPVIVRPEQGPALTELLNYCINSFDEVVEYGQIPDDPLQESPFVWLTHPKGNISLARSAEAESLGEWRFASSSLKSLEALAKELREEDKQFEEEGAPAEAVPLQFRIEELVPDWLEGEFVLLPHWKWLGLVVLLLVGVTLGQFLIWLLGFVVGRRLQSYRVSLERKSARAIVRPLGWLLMVGLWWVGLRFLFLPPDVQAILYGVVKFLFAFAGVWTCYGLVDVVAGFLHARALRTANKFDDLLVPMVRRALKVFVTVFGIIFVANFMGWELKTLLTGLGIGGLAFAFAAKETLGNMFGSLAVLLDRPFQIGDSVKIGDQEGTVESVGFRSTRIRTFYNSLVTIPNADCVNVAIDNLGQRQFRRIRCMLSVLYSTTPEQLEAFCEGVRELIRLHPCTRKDYFHVHVNQFAASSIDIMLNCYLETRDWSIELRERHRLFLDILRLAQKLKVEFAFPTQTLHITQTDSASVASPPDMPDTEAALRLGRREAEAIAKANLGDDADKPPPLTSA